MMKYVEKSSTGTHSVGYTYDSLNNLTALAETFGTTERKYFYAYDGDNRPTSITAGNSFLGYAYDAYGRVSTLTTKHDGNTFATKTYAYKLNANGAPTSQVSDVTIAIAGNSQTYTYTYDKNGNITGISDGTYETGYVYDSANQLIREDNQEANTTTVWTYDGAGNILKREVYPYTAGTLDPVDRTSVVDYTYNDEKGWGDLLTEYDGNTITHDNIGNPLNDGTWNYTWQHGRQLASMSKLDQSETWQFTYNADGMRTKRTNGNRTYQYTYRGGQLTHMTVDGHTMYFTYDASGTPLNLVYDGYKFYYITNLQGDVISIVNGNGQEFVRYTYDAWGKVEAFGSATNLRFYNPLRYRGYVYDEETKLYYLQSRYYDPEMGRFINGDGLLSTGQDIIGHNMFAYCGNNPVNRADPTGLFWNKIGNFFKNVWNGITTLAKKTFGVGYSTTVTIADSEVPIIPDPSPITITGGATTSQTISETGDSSKPISFYAGHDISDPVVSFTAGSKLNVSNLSLETCIGLEDIGASVSLNSKNTTHTFGAKVNLAKLKVGVEYSTAIQWDNMTETAYTNVSINGWALVLLYYFITTGQTVQTPSYQYQYQ